MGLITGAGRIGRLRYLGTAFALTVVVVAVFLVTTGSDSVTGEPVYHPVALVVGLAATWLHYANMVRRLHDCDRSGWLVLLTLVPIVSLGLGLYLLFAGGDAGPNRYGRPAGVDDATWARAKLAEIDRLTAASGSSGLDHPTAGYLNPDGTFDMDGLSRQQQR